MRRLTLALLVSAAMLHAAHAIEPARFRPPDVGLLYPDSQAIRCDPRTGLAASQYVAMARLEYLQGVIVPRVLRALRDVCKVSPAPLATVVRDQMRKFHVTYSLRPLCDGQPYAARANYLWDVPQGLLQQAQTCLKGKPADLRVHSSVLEAASLAVVEGKYVVQAPADYVPHPTCKNGSRVALDGLMDPDAPVPPLTPEMCAALGKLHDIHADQASAFLSGDFEKAGQLGAFVGTQQQEVVRLARDADEAQLVEAVFPGDIDPTSPPTRTADLTRDLLARHHEWIAAFRCNSDRTPNRLAVWLARTKHLWAHYRRAVYVPGAQVKSVCSAFVPATPKQRATCAPSHPDTCGLVSE